METQSKSGKGGRVVSIDALRGFDMFWIIGGGTLFLSVFKWLDNPVFRTLAAQFEHSAWNGCTFEDIIFPLFLFIMGASMPYSLTKRLERGDSRTQLYLHIVKRACILYFLGLVYYGLLDFNFSQQRFVGVLPRIAICYLFTGLIVMNAGIRGQAVWTAMILIAYWLVLKLTPVPGYGAGVFTPEGNLGVYIDQHFLPGKFNTHGAYLGDFTGIIGTFPAVASTLLGVLSGHWLRSNIPDKNKVLGLGAAGVVSIVLSFIWSINLPINKTLWTSSYVLLTGGWSLLLLAFFYWIIDVRGFRSWAFPFVVIGLNSITIYVADRLFSFGSIARVFVHGFIDYFGTFKPVFWAMSVLAVQWLFLYFLYRRKIFLKV